MQHQQIEFAELGESLFVEITWNPGIISQR